MTVSSLAPSLRKLTDWILTQHKLFPDFPECYAEFFDAESINDGVDGWIAVGKEDSNVNEKHWLVTCRAEEGDAVEDVEREPADCKEEKDKGEWLG